MPVVVGELVHDHEVVPAPVQNEPCLVLAGMFREAEYAAVGFGAENIVDTPRGPERFHESESSDRHVSRCPWRAGATCRFRGVFTLVYTERPTWATPSSIA